MISASGLKRCLVRSFSRVVIELGHISPKNTEGYQDPTAHDALEPIAAEEAKLQAEVKVLIAILRWIIDKSGFQLLNRIELIHKKTKKRFM